jgi:hypothetical protein
VERTLDEGESPGHRSDGADRPKPRLRLHRARGLLPVPKRGGNYEIRIKGRLSDSVLSAFEGLSATVEPVETVLHGPVQDQAALQGLVLRIHSLGLELVEIRRLPLSE